jgi:ParB/RepB/Spo0J family partition protein
MTGHSRRKRFRKYHKAASAFNPVGITFDAFFLPWFLQYNRILSMSQHYSMQIRQLPLEIIDSRDRLFALSPAWAPLETLAETIARVGIINPLRVQSWHNGGFRIISGFRRHAVAARMRFQTVPCIVAGESRDPLEMFEHLLMEKLGSRPLHPLEKGAALLKLRNQFQVTEDILLDRYLSLMEPAPSKFLLQQLLDLATLPEILQRAIYEGLDSDLALGLSRWRQEEQARFLDLLAVFKPGKNRQKEIFRLLDELRALRGRPGKEEEDIRVLLAEAGAGDLQTAEIPSPGERFFLLLERLRAVRYPRLAAHEQRYADVRKSLRIPPEIQLNLPRYFEGSHASVTFSFSRRDELRERIEWLREIAEREELDDLIGLL